jgi:hypothetical protein
MIDYVFVKDRGVVDAWHAYFDMLNTPGPFTDAQSVEINRRFISMLKEMSKATGYNFDSRTLESGFYSPQAHADMEDKQTRIRDGLVNLLEGKGDIRMRITSLPTESATRVTTFEDYPHNRDLLKEGFERK